MVFLICSIIFNLSSSTLYHFIYTKKPYNNILISLLPASASSSSLLLYIVINSTIYYVVYALVIFLKIYISTHVDISTTLYYFMPIHVSIYYHFLMLKDLPLTFPGCRLFGDKFFPFLCVLKKKKIFFWLSVLKNILPEHRILRL